MPYTSGTRAVNKYREPFDVYIGRGSVWGNPFVIGHDGDRADVVRKYEEMLLDNDELMSKVSTLRGKTLGCFCAPQQCHGDVLAKYAERD